jgi:uncharacterized protein DUF72
MPTVLVGETRLPKNFKRYASQFSLLELDCEPGGLPGKARLEACAQAAPEGFVFSLIVPARLASLEPGAASDKGWKAAKSAAQILKARWWVVRTPPSVRPTRRTREELAALFTQLKEDGMRVAWEPRGVWDESVAAETAQALGVCFIQDIAREVPLSKGLLYSRLLALGRGARVGLSMADLVAERARGFEEALVVVEGQGAKEIQRALGTARELDAEDGAQAGVYDFDSALDEDDAGDLDGDEASDDDDGDSVSDDDDDDDGLDTDDDDQDDDDESAPESGETEEK